ncbi:MAG: transporter substrate-binding domain-containing protein [Eubacteriales bacterium]|nr:transporter substrate-binding domain-containing protein [Eubacteriales bacterium]
MNVRMKRKILSVLLSAGIVFLVACRSSGKEAVGIPHWKADSAAMQEIISFVASVTEESSEAYVPEKERIAVFDFDGTLFGELFPTYFDNCLFLHRVLHDESFEAPQDVREYAQALEDSFVNGQEEPESPRSTAQMTAECFAGMTVEEYRAYVRDFMGKPAAGFENMTYGEGFYQPMTALIEYLADRGFKVFICSGSERAMVRELIAGRLDEWILPERVIGSTFSLKAAGQGETPGRSYSFTPEDKVLMEGNLVAKTQKTNKVFSIVDEIGQPPVLVFGNSSGDLSMAQYCVQHGGQAFMLLCDDLERDYGNLQTAEKFKETCEKSGYHTVSMRDEFETIYGENVKKTEKGKTGESQIDDSGTGENKTGETEAGAGAAAAVAPSEGNKLAEIRSRGTLLVGTAGDYRPMSYLEPETGAYWGFDTELAEDLADELGVEIEYVPTSWPTLMEDTLAGKFDLAVCGITITEARKEQALMSEGYLGNGKTVLCRAEDAGKYTSLEAVNRPEVRVMVNPGGLNEQFARKNLPDATLVIHDVNQEIPGLIASGEADVMITEIMEAAYYVGQDGRLAAPLIYEPFTNGELGMLMPKGSEDLLEYVNEFLEDERQSGRLDELADEYIYRYFEKEEELQPAA